MQWEEVWVWRECKYGGRAGKATVEALKRWQANREDTSGHLACEHLKSEQRRTIIMKVRISLNKVGTTR